MSLEISEMYAPLPVLERGTSYVLNGDPKGKNMLYTNLKNVVIRDASNPLKCELYDGHKKFKATVAKYSPSGYKICSADEAGNIRIWEPANREAAAKEFRPMAGVIKDIDWDPDSKRLFITGKGADLHGAAIMADSGNNIGKIDKVTKAGNSISFKPTRPYFAAVGAEANEVGIYQGPPMKYAKVMNDHSNYVNCVRFSPDGKYLASGSSDHHVYLYDGKTHELLGEFGDEKKGAHSGGIYSLSWSPDSKELLTTSGDKSAKIWNAETREEVAQFVMGKTYFEQQLASLWMGDHIISVSMSGDLNYLDRNDPSKPLRVVRGHSKGITAICVIPSEAPTHITGDITGKMLKWNTSTGEADAFAGNGHTNKVSGLFYDQEHQRLVSIGWDDKIRFSSLDSMDHGSAQVESTGSQPRSLVHAGNECYVVNTQKAILLFKGTRKVFTLPHNEDEDDDFTPNAFTAHGGTILVETKKEQVASYSIEGSSIVPSSNPGGVADLKNANVMAFSPDGSKLAVAHNKIIRIYQVADNFKKSGEFVGHGMRVTRLAWSPNGQYLSSTATDCSLRVWNIATQMDNDYQKAHGNCNITDLTWLDDNHVVTVGEDCFTKNWSVTW